MTQDNYNENLISSFTNVGSNQSKNDVSIDQVVRWIKSNKQIKSKIEKLRQTDDEDRQTRLKKSLPAITPSGRFVIRKKEQLEAHSGLLVLDFDHVSDPVAFKKRAARIPHTRVAFISPRGHGVKVIVQLEQLPKNYTEHERAFEVVCSIYSQLEQKIDSSGKDVSRLCILSHDPDIFVNDEAEGIDWISGDADVFQVTTATTKLYKTLEDLDDVKTGERNDALNKLTFHLATQKGNRKKETKDELKEYITALGWLDSGVTEKEFNTTFESGWKAGYKQRDTSNIYQMFDKHVQMRGFEISYDKTINSNVYRKAGQTDWKCWNKINKRFLDQLLATFDKKLSEREVGIYLNSYGRKNEFSSFKMYLESIKDTSPLNDKGTAAIMRIFQECYGAPDTPLTQQAGQIFVCSIVARQLFDNVQQRIVPVLVGKQRQGKSNIGIWVLPEHLQQYCKLDFHIVEDDRFNVLSIQNSLTCELGELSGSKRYSERLKGFITRQFDVVNPKFSNYTERYTRRAVFYGTSNESNPLSTDASGHSRFVVIECNNDNGEQVKEWLETHRDLLFSTAYKLVQHYHKRNELHKLLELEDDQIGTQREQNRRYEYNPNEQIDQLISDYIEAFEDWDFDNLAVHVRERVHDLRQTQAIGTVQTRNGDFAKSLKRLGWDRKHTRSGNQWVKHT